MRASKPKPKALSPEQITHRLQARGITARVTEEHTLMVCRFTHPVNGRDYPIRSREDLHALTTELERSSAPFEWKQAA